MVQEAAQGAYKVQSEAQDGGPAAAGGVRALILTGFGINCEEEFAAAYRLAGAEATIVHLNQVLHGQVSIHDFDILNFPGGFSFGDDLGSGVVLANKLRYRQNGPAGRTLLDDIRQFIAAGKFVFGICNGFQVLVKLGLLPNLGGDVTPEVTLTHNASGRYEDRWVTLRVNPAARTPFLTGIDTLEVPVRHGEGRLVIPDAAISAAIEAGGLNCLSYLAANGDGTSDYPHNPNGADMNCAGLTDATGQVFGLMPHPEAFLSAYNHPDWARRRRQHPGASEEGAGLRIFRNIVGHVAQSRLPHPPSPPLLQRGGSLESSIVSSVDGGDVAIDGVEEPAADYGNAALPLHLTADKRGWHRQLKGFGQQMRKQPTEAEESLWQELRGRKLEGNKFRRQHAIEHYIVDFICLEASLIIEADGGIHQEPGQAEYDQGRTHNLQALGYRLLRFSNHAIITQPTAVLAAITHALNQHTQSTPTTTPQSPGSPLSEGEGGRGGEAFVEQAA